jgi:hypothetical protein
MRRIRGRAFQDAADGLRQHGCGNAIWGALQQIPDEGAADAEAHHHELVEAQMIHESELILDVGFPGALDLDRTGPLAARRVAQVRCDTAVFAVELLDRVERRVAG